MENIVSEKWHCDFVKTQDKIADQCIAAITTRSIHESVSRESKANEMFNQTSERNFDILSQ